MKTFAPPDANYFVTNGWLRATSPISAGISRHCLHGRLVGNHIRHAQIVLVTAYRNRFCYPEPQRWGSFDIESVLR
jgi:hypothetical protein